MRLARLVLAALVVAVGAAALDGCGSDGGGGSASADGAASSEGEGGTRDGGDGDGGAPTPSGGFCKAGDGSCLGRLAVGAVNLPFHRSHPLETANGELRREGSRSRVGYANDRLCESTRYLSYEIALALEPPTVVASRGLDHARGIYVDQDLGPACLLPIHAPRNTARPPGPVAPDSGTPDETNARAWAARTLRS